MRRAPAPVVGIFVGGRATRFGGAAKGLLPAPDTHEPLVVRTARLCRDAVPSAEIVLVGEASAYADLGFALLADQPAGVGPLGGLSALLERTRSREAAAIAIAGDLPFLTTALVARLASHAPWADAVAPRLGDRWEPLFARYAGPRCRAAVSRAISEGQFALHRILSSLGAGVAELPIAEDDARGLADWDCPDDIARR